MPHKPLPNDVGQAIADEAHKWLHVREIGNNAGFNDAIFEAKLRDLGWRPGQAWCAYFAKMIYTDVYFGTEYSPIIQATLSPLVIVTWRRAKASQYFQTQDKPVVGGIVCWSTGNGKGHIGIHVMLRDEFNTTTIEGNTSRAGVRDGDQVMLKRRKLQPTAKHNGDWKYLGTILPPGLGNDTTKPAV